MNLNLLAHPFKKPFYSWHNKYLKRRMRKEAQAAGLLSRAVEDYYRTNETYIYDLPFWNAESNRPKMLVEIMKGRLKRSGCRSVLDFGAGAGDLCIALAEAGFEPVYFDISDRLNDFARWRFKKRKMEIAMLRGAPR